MYNVSALAKAAGLSVDTVRYYSRLGLLPEAGRTSGGHRYFDERAIERIQFIRGAQWLDLRLDEIRDLLEASQDGDGATSFTKALLEQKLTAIDAQRDRLDRVRSVLDRVLGNVGERFNEEVLSVGAQQPVASHPAGRRIKELSG
jgi:DNA-binding transcriptional MerR regulator